MGPRASRSSVLRGFLDASDGSGEVEVLKVFSRIHGCRRVALIGKCQVVMPRGGGGIVSTVLASNGVQPVGGQSFANTQVTSEPG